MPFVTKYFDEVIPENGFPKVLIADKFELFKINFPFTKLVVPETVISAEIDTFELLSMVRLLAPVKLNPVFCGADPLKT